MGCKEWFGPGGGGLSLVRCRVEEVGGQEAALVRTVSWTPHGEIKSWGETESCKAVPTGWVQGSKVPMPSRPGTSLGIITWSVITRGAAPA